jgi:hypothetical protein
MMFPEYMRNIKVHKDKVTKRKLGLSRQHKLKKAGKDDVEFGMPVDEFNECVKREVEIDERYMNYDTESEDEETQEEHTYYNKDIIEKTYKEIGRDEFDRLTNKMFKVWSTTDSKISNFMKNLEPYKKYSNDEIKKLCVSNNITDLSHLRSYKRNNSSGYGKIIQKDNNKYYLYPCLIETFIKYF